MRLVFVFILSLALAGCFPSLEPKQIIVDGNARLEFSPETFHVTAVIRAKSDNREGVLSDVAEGLSIIQKTLPDLEGLTHLNLDASGVEVTPIHDQNCTDRARYIDPNICPVTGYLGAISLSVKGAPADRAGQALSLLSELGAESVSLSNYALADMEMAQQKVLDAAIRDARAKADSLASASGAVLTGPLRIQFGDGFSDERYVMAQSPMYEQDVIVVTGNKSVSPAVDLSLQPQPIAVEAKVVAAFEIQ